MNKSIKIFSTAIFVVIAFLKLHCQQDFSWEYISTPETNFLQVELVTDQGYLVAKGDGTYISKDNGASWEKYSETRGLNYLTIDDVVIFRSWRHIFEVDVVTGVTDTLYNTPDGNFSINKTTDGNVSFVSNDVYTVIDLQGNLISETTMTVPSSFRIWDILIETTYPSYIIGNDGDFYLADLTNGNEVTGVKKYMPDSANREYIYSNGVVYSSQSSSNDGGGTWVPYNLPSSAGKTKGFTLQNEVLYILTENALYISSDNGLSFVEKLHSQELYGYGFVDVNNGIISISTRNRLDNLLIVSEDNGDSWIERPGISSGEYHSLAANSQGEVAVTNIFDNYYEGYTGIEALENDHFVVAAEEEFCISPDALSNWECTDFLFYEFFLGVFVKQGKLYIANNNRIMISNDNGATFQDIVAEFSSQVGSEFDAWPPITFFNNDKFIFSDIFGDTFVLFDLSNDSRIELTKDLDYELFQDIETEWNGPTVYILEYSDNTESELSLHVSLDEGINFTATNLDIPVVENHRYQLLNDHNDNMLIHSHKQLFLNQSSDDEWHHIFSELNLDNDEITDVTVSYDDYIYLTLLNGGVYRSSCKINMPLGGECFATAFLDQDNDGFLDNEDCNDNDPNINPNSNEICNGVDDNCDGTIDEGLAMVTFYEDLDGDGYGTSSSFLIDCQVPVGYVELEGDCDDNNPLIHPGLAENPYNGIDDDCNPSTLDDDLDADGFLLADDCDDNNASVNPSQVEVPYNGLDDDCNVMTLEDDLDEDGFLLIDDCDDNNSAINPDAIEIPNNGIDEDCGNGDLMTSIHELTNATIKFFPNPAFEFINIELIGQLNYQASLYDMKGVLIIRSFNQTSVPVDFVPMGLYLMELKDLDSGEKMVERIVIGNN